MSEFFEPRPPTFLAQPAGDGWSRPPRHTLPAVVTVERVIARTDEVAIYLNIFRVYPTEFEFEIVAVVKDENTGLVPFTLDHMKAESEGKILPDKLRLGFELSDGSRVTNTDKRFGRDWVDDGPPSSLLIDHCEGERVGADGEWNWEFRVWPLPPPGPLTFVCEWPAAGIPLTRFELEAAPIIAAGERAQKLF